MMLPLECSTIIGRKGDCPASPGPLLAALILSRRPCLLLRPCDVAVLCTYGEANNEVSHNRNR